MCLHRHLVSDCACTAADQGGIESLVNLPQIYFYKELRGLSPADTTRAVTYESLSFSIKPLFALMMDGLPIFGWHYRPYLYVLGAVGTAAYTLLATAGVAGTISVPACIALFFFGMNSVVWNDVAIDGLTTQKVKEFPSMEIELPSLQQVSLMSVAIVMSLLSGFLIDWVGLRVIFLLAAAFSMLALTAVGLLPEVRDTSQVSISSVLARYADVIACFFRKRNNDKDVRATNYLLGKVTLFGIISCLTIDINVAMVYWYDDVGHYSKGFQGAIVTMGWVFGLIAVIVNAVYLGGVRYKRLFIGFQLIQAAISSLDLLLVCVAKDAFWGHAIALSDRVGAKAFNKLKMIVVIGLISCDTPDRGEASVIAIINALTNFSGTNFVSPMLGAMLLEVLGIERGKYDNLPTAILIRSLFRLVPIIFVPFLVPRGSPRDRAGLGFDFCDLPQTTLTSATALSPDGSSSIITTRPNKAPRPMKKSSFPSDLTVILRQDTDDDSDADDDAPTHDVDDTQNALLEY